MHLVAITRAVSSLLGDCELTHLDRTPIDVERARTQHAAYERALADLGCLVERLPAPDAAPDSVFVEDAAVVLDDVAIATRPGASSRRVEVPGVAAALRVYRPVERIEPPGTLDGGDVLVTGRMIFVGRSGRTNAEGFAQLERLASPRGYTVRAVDVRGCLHLKSAVTAIDDESLIANREWVDAAAFAPFEIVDVDPSEPSAANVARVGAHLLSAAAFPRTRERIERRGHTVVAADLSELAKAEGAVTCCSVIFQVIEGRPFAV